MISKHYAFSPVVHGDAEPTIEILALMACFNVDTGVIFLYSVRTMKKRLRKKYRIGEFRELCFEFTFDYKGDIESPECEQFLHAFADECIEANGLDCEGNLTEEGCNIVAHATDPTQTSETQRQAVKAWLDGRDDVEVKSFGELVDAWYDF